MTIANYESVSGRAENKKNPYIDVVKYRCNAKHCSLLYGVLTREKCQKSEIQWGLFCQRCAQRIQDYSNTIMQQYWYFCLLEIQVFETEENGSLEVNSQDNTIISI